MKTQEYRILAATFGLCAVSFIVATSLLPPKVSAQAEMGVSSELSADTLILKLVDPNGKPVAGAKVGTGYETFIRQHRTIILWSLAGLRIRPDGTPAAVSDDQGLVRLSASKLFSGRFRQRAPIYARQDQRNLVALALVRPDELDQQKTIMLEIGCRVHGAVESKQLSELGQRLHNVHIYLSWQGISILMSYQSEGRYEFLLPSGEYELEHWGASVAGAEAQRKSQKFVVQPNKQEIDLGTINLPATKLASLIGKPAPELRNIKAWKNDGPVKLSDLRGKVVILDFWGYWCGPCIAAMPELIELHDKFVGKDVVIIAVHDNRVASIDEMDEKLQRARKELWQGRDLPFLIALDSGSGRGATHEVYDIHSWPTTLIIDRDGRIIKHFNPSHSAILELIVQRMLGQLPEKWKPWLTSECEACDLDRYYESQATKK